MNRDSKIKRPTLVPHARYRWDEVRGEHQLVFPEGILVLNETGAAIVKLCDGRSIKQLTADLKEQFTTGHPAGDLDEFIDRLAGKGLVRDGADS